MTYKEMVSSICAIEGKTKQVSRSNIQETFKVILELAAIYPGFYRGMEEQRHKIIRKISKRRVKEIHNRLGEE